MIRIKRVLAGLAAMGLFAPCWAATDVAADRAPSAVFAAVNGEVIGAGEFEAALSASVRQKFYHRQPQADQLAALRVEVTDRLVNRVLLLNEGKRLAIRPDDEKVRAEIAGYEQRYRDRPEWQVARAEVLPALTQALQARSVIAQLEAATRVAPPPTATELRAYYDSHPGKFTEPMQFRLSTILLKVAPSSLSLEWDQALQRAQDIVKQLADGADFAEMARLHSGDDSARDGGDMGYRHQGMLPPAIESEIDKMAVGAISEPFKLLEGLAIFRVTERKPARLRPLDEVRGNVAELWAREQGEKQWLDLLARLRATAEIRMTGDPRPDPAGSGDTVVRQTTR